MFKNSETVKVGTNMEKLARFIHGEICDCDDKNCTVETEILDWLNDGDPHGMTIKETVDEAREFFMEAE